MQTKNGRQQISLRLPPDVIAAIDERRDAQGISRDEWIRRAAEYCLSRPLVTPTP